VSESSDNFILTFGVSVGVFSVNNHISKNGYQKLQYTWGVTTFDR